MCTSHATFFYGIWVNFATLNFAATAYQQTRAPLLAVDLILQRRRAEMLQCEGQQEEQKSVADLPEEIWSMVKHELLGAEIRKAEMDSIDGFRCAGCTAQGLWTKWGYTECRASGENCFDAVYSSGYLCERPPKQFMATTALLGSYGLEVPCKQLWHERPEQSCFDWEALSAIALPRRSSYSPSSASLPQITAECHHEYGSGTGVVNFSPEALVVSPADQLKFRRLITDYRLDVVDRPKATILAPSQANGVAQEQAKSSEGGRTIESGLETAASKGEAKSTKLYKAHEPRWILSTSCHPCG